MSDTDRIIEEALERMGYAASSARLAPGAWSFRDEGVTVTVSHAPDEKRLKVSATLLKLPPPPVNCLALYRCLLEWNAETIAGRFAAQDELLVVVSGRSTEMLDVEEVEEIIREVRALARDYGPRLRAEFGHAENGRGGA